MSLPNLSKEQKQYIILGALAAVILITLLVMGIKLSLSSISDAKVQLADLSDKIEKADRTLVRKDQISREFQKTMQVLKAQLQGVPPDRNYYSWATEVIYSSARTVGLEIDTVEEVGNGQKKTPSNAAETIKLEMYALRISAHGDYNNLRRFIDDLKANNPLVRLTGMDISSGPSPDRHNIQLFIQWPINLGAISKTWNSVETKQRELERLQGVSNQIESNDAIDTEPVAEPIPEPTAGVEVQAPVEPEVKPVAPLEEKLSVVEKKTLAEPVAVVKKEPTPPPSRTETMPEPEPVVVPAPPEEPLDDGPQPVVVEVPAEEPPVAAESAEEPETVSDTEGTAVETLHPALPEAESTGMFSEGTDEKTEMDTSPEKTELDDLLGSMTDYEPETVFEPMETPMEDAEPVSEPQAEAVEANEPSDSEADARPAAEPVEPEPSEGSGTTPLVSAGGVSAFGNTYITTEKSAQMLRSILNKEYSTPMDGALGSLLDDLMEDSDDVQ